MARSLSSNEGSNSAGMIDGAALKRYVERVVHLMEERSALNEDIKEVYEEAKSAGFVTKHVRQLCREQMMDQDELRDHLDHMGALRRALGEFGSTPLGAAAMSKAQTPAPKRGRKPRAQAAIEVAQAHLDGGGEFDAEGWVETDRDIGEPAGAA